MGNGLRPPRFPRPSVKSSSSGDFARALPLSSEAERGDKLGKVVPRETRLVFNGEGSGIGFGVCTNVAARDIAAFLVLLEEASPLRAPSETFSFACSDIGNSCGSRRDDEGVAGFLAVRLLSALEGSSGVLLRNGKPRFCAAGRGVDSGLLSRLRGTDFMMTRGRGRGLAGNRRVSLAVGEDGLEVEESLASGNRRAAVRVTLGLLRRVGSASEGLCREEDGPPGGGSSRITISSDIGLNKS